MTQIATSHPTGAAEGPGVVHLDDDRAADVELTGGKAAALAAASDNGLRTLPGVVLTTPFCAEIDAGGDIAGHPDVRRAFDAASGSSRRLVARSSSVVEDDVESSQAGQFESVVGIDGLPELEEAVREVLDSRERAGATEHPIAVLIQPFVEPRFGGVLFGVDPVTGRTDRRVVTAVEGQPDPLVSGDVDGSRYVLDTEASVESFDRGDGAELPEPLLRSLIDMGDRAAEVFGGPQDVEWAVVDGELVLLQSRPVTTDVRGVPLGPVYGPGPVAETFPEPLLTLEADLWIPPLNDGVAEALRLTSALPAEEAGDDLVVVVDGYAAIDLERTGEIQGDGDGEGRWSVRRRIRRLRSAWRVGRLRTALPALAERLRHRVDDDMESLPPLEDMTDRQLVALLGRCRDALRSLHAHEVLMGLLTDATEIRLTGASVAMRVLTEARTDGRPDEEIIATSPVVLALTPPRIGPSVELPPESSTPDIAPAPSGGEDGVGATETDASVEREALRLRVRWVQELSGRAAWELGERLHRSARLADPDHIRWLSLDDLVALVTRRGELVADVVARRVEESAQPLALPARFRISDRGRPIPHDAGGGSGGGTGAGGGRRTGVITHDVDDPPPGSVLVVTTLVPGIGPLLTRLHGVVSETGSILAHLAILAREADVPTVVGYTGATTEFEDGQTVTVDGNSGRVIVGGDDAETEERQATS